MAAKRGRGQPTKLDKPLRTDPEGAIVTIGDEIVERLRYGASTFDAAVAVGIARSTVMDWLREGARHAARRISGETLTAKEARLADFSDREAQAIAEWKAKAENTLEGLSLHRPRTTTTQKWEMGEDGDLFVTERTVKEETLEPDSKVILWRLERRFPDQYGTRRLELTGKDGDALTLSVDVKAEARAVLESMVERIAANTRPEPPAGD